MSKFEGTGGSQLIQAVRKYGFNKDVEIDLGTVMAAPPGLRVQIDGMKIALEADDLIVAEALTQHNRTVSINGGADAVLTFKDELKVGDRVVLASINGGQNYVIIDRTVTY